MEAEIDRQNEYDAASRDSLLDVVLDKMQKAGKTAFISRIVYVARFARRQQNADQHKAFYTALIDKYYQEGEVTGLLLCFPSCMVHLLEAKTSLIMSLLRDTVAAGVGMHHMAEARVVASTEDLPARCFSGYYAAFVNTTSSADTMDAADSTTIVKAATELNAFMRKVGPTLAGQTEMDLKRRLSSWESYYDDTPAPELVLSLVPAEDAPTLEEYLELFDSPINIDLDSERVWPMPAPVVSSNSWVSAKS